MLPVSSRNKRFILIVVGALLLLAFLSILRFGLFLGFAAGDGKNVQLYDFEQGYSLKRIATELESRHTIASARLFVLLARLHGAENKVKAGIYQFSDGITPPGILRRLVAGDVCMQRFAVPEGYSIYQVAELLDGRGLFRKEAFLKACRNRALLAELWISSESVEGYLYPSTYDITPKMTEADLVGMMVKRFEEVYERKFAAKVAVSGMSRHFAITLASIIEKETALSFERPLIASVFLNRLRIGMPLQSDPTAVYKVRAFSGKVSRKDIQRPSPYNTYLINGLPPGPIGNPGSEAIEAVLMPADTRYLYFVAKKDGTHFFSTSLEEHNRAVRKYLKSAVAISRFPSENIEKETSHSSAGSAAEYRNDRTNLTGRR